MADVYRNMVQLELEYLQKPIGNYLDVQVPLPGNYFLYCDIYRVANNTELTNSVFAGCIQNDDHTQIIIGENLSVRSEVTLTPPYRCKGLFIFSVGSFVNNGTISMSSRGASATGVDIPLIENYKISAIGGAGGNAAYRSNGNNGTTPSTLSCAGGGSGGSPATSLNNNQSYRGGKGTSFSGGAGSGGASGNNAGSVPSDTGGAGGNAGAHHYKWDVDSYGGGAGNPGGNPGGSDITNSKAGGNGTGGLLVIFANNLEQRGSLTSVGTAGGNASGSASSDSAGGGSGGGCIVLISDNFTITGSHNVNGGTGGILTKSSNGRTGGAGGTGRYEEITIPDLDITVHNTDNQVYLYYAEKSKITNPNKISIYNGQIILQLEKFGFAYDLNDKRYHFSIDNYYTSQEIDTIIQNLQDSLDYQQGDGIIINNGEISIDLSYFIDDDAEEDLGEKVYSISKVNELLETIRNSIPGVSETENNIITLEEDGLYATINLVTQQQIQDMIEEIWAKSMGNYITADDKRIMTSDGLIFATSPE